LFISFRALPCSRDDRLRPGQALKRNAHCLMPAFSLLARPFRPPMIAA